MPCLCTCWGLHPVMVVEPRYWNWWATSSSLPLTVMQGRAGVACPMSWVFFWLIVRLKRSQASENLSISLWSPSYWWDTMAASSANNRSLIVTVLVFVLVHNLEMLKRQLSDLEWRYTPSVDLLKACFKSGVKKIPKRVGASMQPCLTPLLTQNSADTSPSNCTVLIIPSWKDLTMLRSFGGQPISGSILNRPSLLTWLNALGRSIKAR